jgi:thiol-disulfide isomerase/thioredoxin
MFEQPILVYSEYCGHCETFLDALAKIPQMYEQFVTVNIDVDPQTKQRPAAFYDIQYHLNHHISEVPTIIVQGGEYVLSGTQAFDWLEHQSEQASDAKAELAAFNPNEMGSFSDSYSKFGSMELTDATEQTFKFVHNPDSRIYTPPEDSTVTPEEYNRKQKERETFKPNVTNPQQQQQQQQRKGSYSNGGTQKAREVEQRYQELMLQREEFGNIQPKPKRVDFTSGKWE